MKELALVDGDIVAYRCACTSDDEGIVLARVEEMMQRIMYEVNPLNSKTYLTGSNNYRKQIYPNYKANRDNVPRPVHLQAAREYLLKQWEAKITDGNEADDELGIEQTAQGDVSVICSIDKDLLQIPGYHYNFVKGTHTFVTPFDGLRNFYKQVITGDAADNIPAFDGKFRSSIPKFVQKILDPINEMTEEIDMYKYCQEVWQMEEVVNIYAQCLWIQRKENDRWEVPNQQT